MSIIGDCFEKLHRSAESFSIEVFAGVLKPSWIKEAAEGAARRTQRNRKLPGPFVIWFVIAMGFWRNLSIANIVRRLGRTLGLVPLWKKGEDPASASMVEARDRLGFGPVRMLLHRFQQWLLEMYRDAMSWNGMLLLALDGTTFKTPDSDENRRRFGLPGVSRGKRSAFPQMRALFLVSTTLRFVMGAWFAPYGRGEMTLALRALGEIPKKALLLLDRYYLAWQFLLGLLEGGHHFLVRVPKHIHGRRLCQFGAGDYLVEVKIPRAFRRRFPQFLKVVVLRELTVRIRGRWYRYFTSLLDASRFPGREMVALYARRWEVETGLDEIKTHQCGATTVNRPVIFRSKRARRVLQEAYGLVIAYNLVRVLMTQAAQTAIADPLRISFVDSVDRIREAALAMALARTDELPMLYRELLASIALCLLPRRRRRNRREVCIKMSAYPKKWKTA
jgi:hypothetical protein